MAATERRDSPVRSRAASLAAFFLFLAIPAFGQGADAYRGLLDRNPRYFYYQTRYLEALAAENRHADGSRYLESLRTQPGSAGRHLMLTGLWHMLREDRVAAQAAWKAAVPLVLGEYSYLEELYRRFNLYHDAARLLRLVLAASPDDGIRVRLVENLLLANDKRSACDEIWSALLSTRNASTFLKLFDKAIETEADLALAEASCAALLAAGNPGTAARAGIRRYLAALLLRHGQPARAAREALACIGLGLDDAAFYWTIARALVEQGDPATARTLLARLDAPRKDDRLRLLEAELLLETDPRAARTAFARLLAQGQYRDACLRGLSLAAERSGDPAAALAALERIAGPGQEDSERAARLSLALDRRAEARDWIRRLDQPARGLYDALGALAAGNPTNARTALAAALSVPAHRARVPEALEFFFSLQPLAHDRTLLSAFVTATLLHLRGDHARAGAGFLKLAAGLEPFWAARARIAAGRLYERAGDPDAAARAYTLARGGPLADHALFHEAELARRLGKREQARALYLELVARHPGSAYLYAARRLLSTE